MITWFFILLFIISFLLALRSVDKELSVPKELKNLKIKRDKISGVILFLKKKIVHYSSSSPADTSSS